MSFGAAAGDFWPYSGPLVLLLLGIGVAVSALWRTSRQERPRLVGLILFMSVFPLLALAVGRGRGGVNIDDYGLEIRYTLYGVPLLCCVYLACLIYAPFSISQFGQIGLFAVMGFALSLNAYEGREVGAWWKGMMDSFKEDLLAGMP